MDAANRMSRAAMLAVLGDLGVDVAELATKSDDYLAERLDVELEFARTRPRRRRRETAVA